MDYLECIVECAMKNFLKLPNKEEVIAMICNLSGKYYTIMQSCFPFNKYNDIWIYYNAIKNIPKGCRYFGVDDTNYHMVDKNMLIIARLKGCKLKNI